MLSWCRVIGALLDDRSQFIFHDHLRHDNDDDDDDDQQQQQQLSQIHHHPINNFNNNLNNNNNNNHHDEASVSAQLACYYFVSFPAL